jgi:leucyl-tRNA synthetase
MAEYHFSEIEPAWRQWWDDNHTNEASDDTDRAPYYCLDMFPYPSGSGLHVGHWRNYVLSDVWARYKRLEGYNVLHPMGWDAFGLPAENFAIKNGIHPAISTTDNIANMKRQLKEIGASYDWSREISTSDPKYYRWTQWIFLQMYKKGLAFRHAAPVNWCPECQVVVANEEAPGGEHERCGTEVLKRDLVQWFLRITRYADRLLDDLDTLDWPEKVKTMQANWIGRSEGAHVTFQASPLGSSESVPLEIFTTRPDTLFGATYMVLAPEHPLVEKLAAPSRKAEVDAYVTETRKLRDMDRTSAVREKTGVPLGSHAINPVNGQKMPIWIADYVLMGYGTGAIMAVPAHDERDFEFATKFELPIVEVIHNHESARDETGSLSEAYSGEGTMINSGRFDGQESQTALTEIVKWLDEENLGTAAITYRMRDWLFSRQRYWGEPIPIVYCDTCGEVPLPEEDLPLLLPEVESYQPTGTGESPLAAIDEWVNTTCPTCGGPAKRETDTMPQWAGSSWYFLRFTNPHLDTAPFDPEQIKRWLPVDMYIGGIEHAVLHLLYARFFTKVLYDLDLVSFTEPFQRLFNQGMITRKSEKTGKLEKMSKSKGNVVSPDDLVKRHGTDSVRLYELFVGPPELDSEWNDQGILGISRFLKRFWSIIDQNTITNPEPESITRARHVLVKHVTEGLETLKFNTLISRMMEFTNFILGPDGPGAKMSVETRDTLIVLLSPFAPHMAEEMWKQAGHKSSVFNNAKWPEFDEAMTAADTITIAVQVKGKLRGTVEVPADIDEDALKTIALDQPNVRNHTEGKEIRKVIVVPGRLVNIVV